MGILRKKTPPPAPRQRLRTLDSDTPAPYAYHSSRNETLENTGRNTQREPRLGPDGIIARLTATRLRTTGVGLSILIIAFFTLWLSHSPAVKMENSPGLLIQEPSTYADAANRVLDDSPWNSFKLTANTAAVNRSLATAYPELVSVSTTVPFIGNKPVVHLIAAQPALILSARNGSYVVDTRGVVLLPADKLPSGSHLSVPVVTDKSNLSAVVGKHVLSSDQVTFIRIVTSQMAAKGVKVSSIVLPASASELDLYLTGKPFYAKFNLESPSARQQAGTLLAVLSELQSKHITPASYIDVRVDGRAYYL